MVKRNDKLDPNGRFGRWITDEYGLPAYEYTCDQDADAAATLFTTRGGSNLHWHQIGNDRITAIATNRGEVQSIESSRGLQWLNYRDPSRFCPGAGIALLLDGDSLSTDLYERGAPANGYRRLFGAGYYKKVKNAAGFGISHRIFAPFGDEPVLICELSITNLSCEAKQPLALEFFGVNLHYMSPAGVCVTRDRTAYGHSGIEDAAAAAMRATGAIRALDIEAKRSKFAARFVFEPRMSAAGIAWLSPIYTGDKRPRPESRSKWNYYPKPMFAALLNSACDYSAFDARDVFSSDGTFRIKREGRVHERKRIAHPCFCLGSRLLLSSAGSAGDTARLCFIYGYGDAAEAETLVLKYRSAAAENDDMFGATAAAWNALMPELMVSDPVETDWSSRESRWHVYYTRSASLHDEYHGCHYVPQGGAYEFIHGLRGAVRDYSLFIAALTYIDPARARELLELCFRLMTPKGRIMYASGGYGMAAGLGAHEQPSDLQLFLLWALTEYLFFTRDSGFLDLIIPFYPHGCGSSTIRERVKIALEYFYNKIGLGPHGLVRVGDGDWSDGISLFARDRRRFLAEGESVFNTAMALYVLPRVADMLDGWDPAEARRARDFSDDLKKAVQCCWNGKWFFRAYDGAGRPMGNSHIFLEHHVWLLIARVLPDDMARSVIRHVREILDAPSSFGQYVLYPPKKSFLNFLAPGWDVNGGVWFAMNYLLTWGYALYDPDMGWASLRKNSLAYKAAVDPNIWYGIWSGPDSFNANHAARPGETYFQLPTPMTDFPVMNLNIHACFIAALIKLCGVEPSKNGIVPKPLLPFSNFRLSMPTFDIACSDGEVAFKMKTPMPHTEI